MILFLLACTALVLATLPALLLAKNLSLYQAPPALEAANSLPRVSILIPARNEERSIESSVAAALASERVELEVIVLDDHSTDRTAQKVQALAARDPRVRLETAPPLPTGWCGKQHACFVLSQLASSDWLLFLDADVRLAPAAAGRAVAFSEQSGAALVSGVPLQETGTLLEKLLIPLIHFILLGFLPLARMRSSTSPSLGAGCGQLFLARRAAYTVIGGHAAVRASLHDGLKLPRAFRAAGFATDLFDATHLATCHMYHSAGEVWRGLAKNAVEGLAAPAMILPATLLLGGGQVLPLLLMLLALGTNASLAVKLIAALALGVAYAPRVLAAIRFRQSWLGVALHPLGVALFLTLQWYALLRWALGKPAAWKDREYQDPQNASPPASATLAQAPASTSGR
jgi:hypothetical protein